MRILATLFKAFNTYFWAILFVYSIVLSVTTTEQLMSVAHLIIATIALAVLEITQFTPNRNTDEQSN